MFFHKRLPFPRFTRTLVAACTIGLVSVAAGATAQATQPAASAATKPASPASNPASGPAAASKPPAPGQPEDVQKTIDKLNQSAPAAKSAPAVPAVSNAVSPGVSAVQPIPTAPAAAEVAPVTIGRLQREGTFLASRRGRVIKAPSGEWQYHFDTGPDNRLDAPMVLMPCLNLQAIEKLAERGGEALSFSMSGQVFVYKGRNFLLPTLYTVNRRGDVTPAQ